MTVELPRVTEILRSAGLIDVTWFTPETQARGSAVHLACQYYDEGDLDESSIDPTIAGYVVAYAKWAQESGRESATWIECPMHDKGGLYRGTSDRIFTCRPRSLWDIKTGCHLAWHALQLAAYVNMLDDPYSYSRFALYLKADGTYSVREFPKSEYGRDLAVFMSALNLWYWKENNHG